MAPVPFDAAARRGQHRPMRPGPSILAAVVVAAAAACFDADVGDAILACDDAADCPEPLFCDGGRCRRGSADDTTPPGIVGGSARLGEGTIRPGSGTSLAFIPTEPLGESPRFTGEALTFGDVSDDDGTLTVDVTALAGAAEGGHDITVVVVDVAGNSSEPVFLVTLQVDATAPALQSSQVPTTVAPGQPIEVAGGASEALSSATCTFAPVFAGDDVVVAGLVDGSDFVCEGPAFSLGSTAVQVSAALVDVAGNRADVSLGSVSIINVP